MATQKAQKKRKNASSGDATPMPVSKAKKALAEYMKDMSLEELAQLRLDIQNHPDAIALKWLEAALTQVHLAPELRASPVLSEFVFLMRETLAEFVPGYSLGALVEPLHRLLAAAQARHASKAPRPRRRSPLRARIVKMMKIERASGTEFKVFLRRWEREAIDGLVLSRHGGEYTVLDDATDITQRYELGTLTKMYSSS